MSQYRAIGGTTGFFNIPAGAYCTGIAAFVAAGVANGQIQVGGDTPVPIPTGGSQSLNPPKGDLIGPITINFINTAGYGVEIVQ